LWLNCWCRAVALKLRQIEAFKAVMREGSMVRASGAMNVTQPAISYLISGLEAQVGFSLFSRRNGKLAPTPEALQLIAEVDRLYDGLKGIETAARQIANHERAAVRILITQALAGGRIVSGIGQFAVAHPGLKLDVDVDHRMTIMHRISSAQADLGILSLPPEMNGATATKLFDSELVCISSGSAIFSQMSSITPADLAGVPIVALKTGGVIRPLIESWFASARVSPSFVIEVGDARAAIELVRGGMGVTIVSSFTVPEPRQLGVLALPLEPRQDFAIGAIVPVVQHPNRAARQLVEFLKASVQQ
jgi:DNA-binding transcriptional LysR family regulator